jgi:hypothetical protein
VATIIDALVTTLGLDSSGYKKGAADALSAQARLKAEIGALETQIGSIKAKSSKATKAQDDLQIKSLREVLDQKRKTLNETRSDEQEQLKRQKEQTGQLNKVRDAALEILAIFTAGVGIKEFVTDLISGDAATARFAANLGESAQTATALGAVIRGLGGDAKEGLNAIANLKAIQFAERAKGDYSKAPVLSRLGVSPQDLNDIDGALMKIAATAKTMPKDQFFQFATEAGFSQGAINALEMGDVELARNIELAKQREKLTDAQIGRDQALIKTLNDLVDAFRGAGRELLGLIPDGVLRAIDSLTKDHLPVLLGLLGGLAVAAGIAGVAIVAALLPVELPILAIIVALSALGALIGLIAEDFSKGKDGFIDWSKITPILDQIKAAMDEVGAAAKEAYDAVPPEVWQFLGAVLKAIGGLITNVLVAALHNLAALLHTVADVIRLIVDLLTGNWSKAWKDAGNIAGDIIKTIVQGWRDARDAVLDFWYAVTHKGAQRPVAPLPGPATGTPAPTAAPGQSATARNFRTLQALAYFKAQGWTEAQARGIVAGINAESKLDPTAVNPKSGALGIGQWLGPRKRALLAQYGPNPTYAQQLAFLNSELQGNAQGGGAVRAASTEREAATAYVTKVMRPKPGAETIGDLNRANNFLLAADKAGAAPALDPGLATGAAGAAATQQVANDNSRSNSVANDIKIGEINVNGVDTNKTGEVAAGIGQAVRGQTFVAAANTGLG